MDRNLAVVCTAIGMLAPTALAKPLQCDKTQTHCIAESTDVTIGDQVGIFNDDGQLVAKGEVRAMRGERRAVLIDERFGEIHKNYHLALLDKSSSDENLGRAYSLYRDPAKISVGTEAGYSEVGIGEGNPAAEMSVYAAWRTSSGLQLVTRAVYLAMAGTVTQTTGLVSEQVPMNLTGMGLLGGFGYVAREGKPVSFRGEIAGGVMQVHATIAGDESLVNDGGNNVRVKNGIGPYGRASLGPVLNFDDWHVHLDYAPSLIDQALANTLAAGVSKDLK